jgi:hypothetical protein
MAVINLVILAMGLISSAFSDTRVCLVLWFTTMMLCALGAGFMARLFLVAACAVTTQQIIKIVKNLFIQVEHGYCMYYNTI